MATIPSDEIPKAMQMLKERMRKEGISLQEAHDREVEEHNNAITFDLAMQGIKQEQAESSN